MAKHAFGDFRTANYPKLDEDNAFELYATHLVTQSHGVSTEVVKRGIGVSRYDLSPAEHAALPAEEALTRAFALELDDHADDRAYLFWKLVSPASGPGPIISALR